MEPRLVLLVAVTAGAIAGPISTRVATDPRSCASQCVGSSKFNYAAGSTYDYTFETSTRTTMSGAAEDHAMIRIMSDVSIEALTSCEMVLTMSSVRVLRSNANIPQRMLNGDSDGEFKQALEARPLRFSFQDGVVEQICPDLDESTWALNVKRAVLSAFQNSMSDLQRDQRVRETDVTGECYTDYRVTQRGRRTSVIKKSKDLLGCDYRHGYKSSFNSMPYKIPNAMKSLPLMKSTHDCDQIVTSDGLLQKSSCSETHVFRPFSKDHNGAVTEASHTLEYKRTKPYVFNSQGNVPTRVSLTYEHSLGLKEEEMNRRDATSKLQELCRTSEKDIRPEVPQMFMGLVQILKNANLNSLKSLYRQLVRGQLCRNNAKLGKQFFVDAIPVLDTVDSMTMMLELINEGAVSKKQADLWLTSLAFIQNPTAEMITEIEPLMSSYNPFVSKLLVAAMVNNFCQKNENCVSVRIINKIISSLESDLDGCDVTSRNYDKVLVALRALGNIGQATRIAISVQPCFTKKRNAIEIRVAALDAFRRLSCEADRNDAMAVYRDTDEDSEVRIAGYLVAMQCPSEFILSQVKDTLATEKANQVGSFVWSHLINLQETSSPLKQDIRQILEDVDLTREFDLDKRKFSRNYEGSLFSEKLNAGAMAEGNLVWSSRSFVPRSATVNLTVDLFGESVNLLEFGGRVEGLETILESFLGPADDTKEEYKDTKVIRKSKLDRMKEKYAETKDDLHASMFVRVFGNELRYLHLDSTNWPKFKDALNFNNILDKISKDHDFSHSSSFVFLDSSLIIPTCAGLPLNLTVQGAASVNVKASGKIDLRQLTSKPKNMLIEGQIQPSGAVEVTGMMTVDAFVTKTGLKMVTTMHSSSMVKGRVELAKGQVFNVELDTPEDKMEVFNVKSSFFIVHDSDEQEQKMIQRNRKSKEDCWGDRLVKITGMDVCGEIGFPNASMIPDSPYFPFTGPFNFGITIHKKDTHSGYKMTVKTSKTKDVIYGHIGLNTPGSRINREIQLDGNLDLKSKSLEIGLVSPWKEVSIKSSFVNDRASKHLKGFVWIDKTDRYSLDAEVKIARDKLEVTYLPLVELTRPTDTTRLLTGSIIRTGTEQIDADLHLKSPKSKPVHLKVAFSNTKTEKRLSTIVTLDPKKAYSFLARALISSSKSMTRVVHTLSIEMPKKTIISVKGSTDYRVKKSLRVSNTLTMDGVLNSPMKFTADMSRSENIKKKRLKHKSSAELSSEFIDLKLNGRVERKKIGVMSSQIGIDYKLPKSKLNKITVGTKYMDKSSKNTKKYQLNANMDVKQNSDYNMILDFGVVHNPRHNEVDLQFRHGPNVRNKKDKTKELNFVAMADHKVVPKGVKSNIDYKFKIMYPYQNIDLHAKGHHSHDKKNLSTTLSVYQGKKQKVDFAFKLRDRSTKFLNLEGTFVLVYPGRDISIVSNLTQKSKIKFLHSINVNLQKKQKSTIVTSFENPGSRIYTISSEAVLHKQEPIHFDGVLGLNWENLEVSTKVRRKNAVYGGSLLSNIDIKEKHGNWILELVCPHKQVTVSGSGGRYGDTCKAEIQTKWSHEGTFPKTLLKVSYTNQRGNNKRIGGSFEVQTPWRNFEKISGEIDYINRKKDVSLKVSGGCGRKELSATTSMDKPFTWTNLGLSFRASTPFKDAEILELKIVNKYDKVLFTHFKQVVGPHNAEITVNFDKSITNLRRDVEAGFELKSSHRTYKIVSVSISHHDDLHKFETRGNYNDNGDIYQANFDATVINTKIAFNGRSNLVLSSPSHRITTILNHEHRPYVIKTEFSSDWGRGQKILIDISGDYENVLDTKVNGGVIVQTPWDPVKDIDGNFMFEYGRRNLKLHTYAKRDRRSLIMVDSNYDNNHNEIDFDVSITGALLKDDISGKWHLSHNDGTPTRSHIEFQWAQSQKISGDSLFDINLKEAKIDVNTRITTPFEGARSISLSYSNEKRDELWVSSMTLDFGINKFISGETQFQMNKKKMLHTKLTTSFSQMSLFEAGFELSGSTKNLKVASELEVRPVLGKMSGELSWNIIRNFDAKFRVDTPFKKFRYLEITGKTRPSTGGRKATVDIKYYPSRIIELDTTYRVNGIRDFYVDSVLRTPYVNYRNFEGHVSFKKPGIAIEGKASIKTPFQNYESITANFNHANTAKNIQNHFEVNYGPGKTVKSDLFVTLKDVIAGSITFRSPYKRMRNVMATFNHEGMTWKDFNTRSEVEYEGKRIEGGITFRHGRQTTGTVIVKTPYAGYELIEAEMYRQGKWNDLKFRSSVKYGQKVHQGAVQLFVKDQKVRIGTTVKTPYLKDIRFRYNKDGPVSNMKSDGEISYGQDYKFASNMSFSYSDNDFSLRCGSNYVWKGVERSAGATIVKQGGLNNFKVELGGHHNKKVMHGIASFQRGSVNQGNFWLTTPFEKYSSVGLSFDHTGNESRGETNTKFNFRDGMEYESKVEYVKQRDKKIDIQMELKTPHKNYEHYKMDYRHNCKKNGFVAETEIRQGSVTKLSGDLNIDYSGKAAVTMNTPYNGYRKLQASGEYRKRNTRHVFSASVNAGKHGTISADSSFDVSGEPYTGEASVQTPFKGYENMRLYFTHRGSPKEFKTTAIVNIPNQEPVSAEGRWFYRSPSSMDCSITLTSGFEHLKDVRLALTNTKSGDEYMSHLELGCEDGRTITADGSYMFRERMRGIELSTGLSLRTPYRQVTSLNLRLDHLHNREKVAEKVIAMFNGKSYLDADMDYTRSTGTRFARKHEGSINVREPQPMSMTIGTQLDRKQFMTDVYLNWNKDDLESNIKFETAYNDRTENRAIDTDFRIKLIHPVRTMGVEGIVKRLPNSVHNKALVTWDEKRGSTFAYDVQLNDKNRPYRQSRDGSIKLVVPMRSVKVSGNYVNSSSMQSLGAAFLWDADRDQTKQVAIKVDSDMRGKSVKRTLLLHLPSIKKDYKLETSVVRNQGNTFFDGTTMLSYSTDPRHTLTLTTRMENLGENGHKNYSVTFGIHHPATYTNLLLNTHAGHSVTSCSGGLVMSYEARNKDKKYFVARGEVNRVTKQIEIEASSPLKHVLLTGKMDRGKPYHVSLVNHYDHFKVVSTDLTLDTDGKNLGLDFAYNSEDPGDSIHVSAGYLDDNTIQAEITRKKDNQKIPESMVNVHLNSSHILHTKVSWRPASIPELQAFLANRAQAYKFVMKEATSEISQAMGQEVTAKYRKIANEIYTEVAPVFDMLEKEMSQAKLNLDLIRRELRRAYRRNDLFIRSMGNAVNQVINNMFGEFGDFVERFDRFYMATERMLTQWLHTVKHYPITEKYMAFVEDLINRIRQSRKVTDAQLRMMGYQLEKVSQDLYMQYLRFTRSADRKLKVFVTSVTQHPSMQGLRKMYNQLQKQMANMPELDYQKYGQMMDQMIQKGLEPVNLKDDYNRFKQSTKQIVQEQLNTIRNHKDIKKANAVANELYQQFVWAYKYWDMDAAMRRALVELYQTSRDLVFMELNNLKDSLVDLHKSRVILYEPENGQLEFELYLPVPLKSLTEPPVFNVRKYINRMKAFANRYIPNRNYSVWDTYYKYVPMLKERPWFGPKAAFASVIGNQHFITFDKRHFDFAGSCSYVLARDMVDDNFTIILNYDNNMRAPKKKSLLVMLKGLNIEVFTDKTIKVNEQSVELPYLQDIVSVMYGGHEITVDNGRGVSVSVDLQHDMYTIILSGWYHGRVAGLLGTYDNEPMNDMMSSAHEVVDDVTGFANSWEIGRKTCRSSNRAAQIKMVDLASTYPECVADFQAQDSQFRPCYSVVSPDAFLHACVGYIQKRQSVSSARCMAAAQYLHQCQARGVYMHMPKECVTCELSDDTEPVAFGETVQMVEGNEVISPPSSADVILVLEETQSKIWTPTRLGEVVLNLDTALKSRRMYGNRFGLVGYGGPLYLRTEHMHTFDGELFSKAKGFLKGVEHIAFSDSKGLGDGLAAVRMATKYHFRPGVSKIIVFIPASECEGFQAQADLHYLLQTNGFSMHILRNKAMDIRDNRPVKNAHIFGMDNNQILTMRERPGRNEELFKKLVHPEDMCARLALGTNGSVFDSTHLEQGSSRMKKDFLKTFAARVGSSAAPSVCQSCKCEQDDWGLPRTTCRPCDQASFLWKYAPNWWTSNKTPAFKNTFASQLKEYINLPTISKVLDM